MITRYSRPEMRAIWTDENKLKIWLQIELLASEALVKEEIVPAKDFAKIKAGCDKWFADLPGLVARQRELEKVLNHDVIGFTTAVAEAINDDASRWFHFGLTSSDVGDTCYAVQMQQSADILIADVAAGEAEVEPAAGVVVDLLSDGGGETDDVVVEGFFQFTLAGDEAGQVGEPGVATLFDLREIFGGHHAFLHEGFAGEQLDLEPDAEFVFIGPNRPHVRTGIARNHRESCSDGR